MKTDMELLTDFNGGDRQAFNELYERYKRSLFIFSIKMVQDESIAQDMVQETFIRVFVKSSQFEPYGSVSGWLFRITRNLCLNHIRANKNISRLGDEEVSEKAFSYMPEEYTGDMNTIQKIIDQLPAEQKEALVLRDIQGFSYLEISEITGISLANVKIRIFRGRETLRKMLKEKI